MGEVISAANLKSALKARAWNQSDLVRVTGLDKSTVSAIFQGRPVSTRTFRKIVEALAQHPEIKEAAGLLER